MVMVIVIIIIIIIIIVVIIIIIIIDVVVVVIVVIIIIINSCVKRSFFRPPHTHTHTHSLTSCRFPGIGLDDHLDVDDDDGGGGAWLITQAFVQGGGGGREGKGGMTVPGNKSEFTASNSRRKKFIRRMKRRPGLFVLSPEHMTPINCLYSRSNKVSFLSLSVYLSLSFNLSLSLSVCLSVSTVLLCWPFCAQCGRHSAEGSRCFEIDFWR